jgi:hypothetical protein
MIARIGARVAEGKAFIFSDLSRHQCAHRARCGMKIRARNPLKDRIVDVKEGASPARLLRNRHCAPRFTVLRHQPFEAVQQSKS